MKIVGSKYLDKNDYSNISINDKEIIVRKNKGKYKTMHLENSFVEELKKLDDDDMIRTIIEYYLYYHKISVMERTTLHGNLHVVGSSDGTSLCINRTISDELLEKVYEKYKGDRESFTFSRDFYGCNLMFITTASSLGYTESGYIEDDRSCRFYLATENGRIVEQEKEFLIDVFNPMLADGEVAIGREDGKDNFVSVTFLRKSEDICEYVDYGAPKVIVSPSVLPVIETLVISHNDDFNNKNNNIDRPKQLRMEE